MLLLQNYPFLLLFQMVIGLINKETLIKEIVDEYLMKQAGLMCTYFIPFTAKAVLQIPAGKSDCFSFLAIRLLINDISLKNQGSVQQTI